MKHLLLSLILMLVPLASKSQTVVYYDYMETWNWAGYWWIGTNSNWYTNISVSAPTSAVIVGTGNNTVEADWYVLPNVALDPTKMYLFRFRLAAQSISNPSHPAAGNDTGDYVDVQISTDGGLTYTSEVRIRGFGNANWDYNLNGTIYETLNGVNNIYTPAGGGDRTATGDGYSEISLEIPFGTTDLAVDLYCRVNRPGEEWWIDNVELLEIASLPVELVDFNANHIESYNYTTWKTASEQNTSHFLLKRSTTLEFDENSVIEYIPAAGNSNQLLNYESVDRSYDDVINYYQLVQVDLNGQSVEYGPISVDNRDSEHVIRRVNLLGQEVDSDYSGIIIEIDQFGNITKTIK